MEELEQVQVTENKNLKQENPYLIPISIVVAGLVIGAAIYFQSSTPAKLASNLSTQDENAETVSLDIDNRPFLGDPVAEVAILEFSDFQCPFCKRFFDQTLSDIKEKYVKSGQVKFVYRDFPISSIHQYAQKAAEAALCANDENIFWQMHDKIFENQDNLVVDNLKNLAKSLGVSDAFNSCLDSGKYEQVVKDDFELGVSLGVEGTPTFFIGRLPMQVKSGDKFQTGPNDRGDYKVLVGALPFSEFEKVIEEVLKK